MHTCLSESKPIFRFFRPAFVAIITRITKVSGEKREKSVVCQQSQKPVMLLSGVVVVGYSNPQSTIHNPHTLLSVSNYDMPWHGTFNMFFLGYIFFLNQMVTRAVFGKVHGKTIEYKAYYPLTMTFPISHISQSTHTLDFLHIHHPSWYINS